MSKTENNLFQRVMGYEGLVRWNAGWTKVIPDSRTFTFKLHEGIRWFDGAPFTADDLVFWYEAIFLNDDLQSMVESWTRVGKHNLTVKKLDDYTAIFQFTEPQGLFLQRLASVKKAVIGQVVNHDPRLHKTLSHLTDYFAFESILSFLEQKH